MDPSSTKIYLATENTCITCRCACENCAVIRPITFAEWWARKLNWNTSTSERWARLITTAVQWVVLSTSAGAKGTSCGRGIASSDLALLCLTHPNYNGSRFGGSSSKEAFHACLKVSSLWVLPLVGGIALSLDRNHVLFHPALETHTL